MARSVTVITHTFYEPLTPPEGVLREPQILESNHPNQGQGVSFDYNLTGSVRAVVIGENMILVSKHFEDDCDPDDRETW
jgi:hypothetical protein